MAVNRAAVIKAKDAGRWLKVETTVLGVRGDTVEVADSATRYTNLNTLDAQIPSTYWYPNQWGDETKTLFDAANGYEIKDKFFSDPVQDTPLGAVSTPNVAGGARSSNALDRTAILYSFDLGAYIYVTNPAVAPASWEVFIVSEANQATRFDDLLDVATWLNATSYGNVTYGYGIQQYVFTKQPQTPSYSAPALLFLPTKTIVRSYVPFSNQEGAYLRVDDTSVPILNMTFSYVANAWEGTRFVNTNDIKAIIDGRPDFFGTTTKAGWELPQFFFTQTVQTHSDSDFKVFFDGSNPCGVTENRYGNTLDWFNGLAQEYCFDFQWFYSNIVDRIFQNPSYWADYKCFVRWWEAQDHRAFQEWLYTDIWKPNSCE